MGRTTYAAGLVVLALASTGCGSTDGAPPEPPAAAEEASRQERPAGWQRLPDAPLAGRTGATVVPVGRDVLVVGGWEFLCPPNADCVGPESEPFTDGALFDARSGRWLPVADAPTGFFGSAGVAVGEDVYVLATCRGMGCGGRPLLLRYDVRDDDWDDLGAAPTAAEPVVVGDRLLFASGTDEQGEHPDYLFDPAEGAWQELPDDPLPSVYDRFAVVDDDRVLVLGSPTVGPDEDSGDKLVASYDLRARTWSRLPDAPGHGYQAWRVGDEVWLNSHFGDGGGGVLDLGTDTWRPPPPGPDAHDWEGDAAGVLGDGEAAYEYAAGWVRDTRADRWLRVPDTGRGRYDEAVAAVGDALLVFGGQRWSGGEGELLADARLWRPPA